MHTKNRWLYGIAMAAALFAYPAFARGGGGHSGGGHSGGGHFSGGHFGGGHVGGWGRGWSGHGAGWGGRYWGRPFGGSYGPWRYGPSIGFAFGTPAWYGGRWYYGWTAGSLGWWWGVNSSWYYYPQPIYPYPTVAPTVAAPENTRPLQYYCPSSRAYYPQVAGCDEGWQEVAAQPAAPSPQRPAPSPLYVPNP